MNYKQKALDHVRSVCPELMDLSFGCWVAIEARPDPLLLQVVEPYRNREQAWLMTDHMVWHEGYEKDQIIGHTPHLEHWLRALDKRGIPYRYTNCGVVYWDSDRDPIIFHFNDEGQPESEEDYRKFCCIIGVTCEHGYGPTDFCDPCGRVNSV